MTPQDRTRIAERWLALAQMFGKELPRPALSLMLDAVSDLEPERVEACLLKWVQTSKAGRHPFPAEIREQIVPLQDDDADARDAAARIIGAVRKFGYTMPALAREYMGEVGWQVVFRLGGWPALCESMHDRDIPMLTAQYRDLAKSVIARTRRGVGDVPPILPPGSEGALQNLASGLVKRIDGGSK